MAITVRTFDPRETDEVVALWHAAGLTRPWNDPHRDIARKLAEQPELFLVAVEDEDDGDENAGGRPDRAGRLVGTVMAGSDGHRGWMYYLAVAEDRRREGVGRHLVVTAEALLLAAGCPKVQLMVRTDNAEAAGFYDRLGYERAEVVVLGRRLDADG